MPIELTPCRAPALGQRRARRRVVVDDLANHARVADVASVEPERLKESSADGVTAIVADGREGSYGERGVRLDRGNVDRHAFI